VIIEIKKVEVKKHDEKSFRRVQDTSNKWHSCWDEKLFSLLEEGAVLEVELEMKGDFSNIMSAKLSEAPDVKQPAELPANHILGPKVDTTRVSIERQVAAKLALEFLPNKDLEATLQKAERIYQWISGSIPQIPNMPKVGPEVAEPPAGTPEHSGLWPDWGKCITYCASRKITRQQILDCIGKPDFTDTDPNEKWPKIKELLDIRKAEELTPEELPF